jgi:hypothetical protein
MTVEAQRLEEARKGVPWRRWGPYLSERQWGTVREDYSDDANAWEYFSHDQARSRAYRWGEDGLAGISDDKSRLCFALALWNGQDPILKERLFGLTNAEGNHGEDVKEYYFYLDNLPSHAYMKWLYKYPQRAYPYDELVRVNRERGRGGLEYELLDTGVFDGNRYFDVLAEYAKASPEDILIRITVHNRGPEPAELHLLPTLWFRNTWAWGDAGGKPSLRARQSATGRLVVAEHPALGQRYLHVEERVPLLFTENETNVERLFHTPNPVQYVKDGIHAAVVQGRQDAVNPALIGTKVSSHHVLKVPAGASRVVRLRLTDGGSSGTPLFGAAFETVFSTRVDEADAFYDSVLDPSVSEDQRRVSRQALAGMLWSKQHYFFDLDRWLDEHDAHPLRAERPRPIRNRDWFHMVNDDIISMPDKWEYPWYAAWDLAFHTVALARVDLDFAKSQIQLMLRDVYLHPSGQLPAYEWNFGDVNPPVHAWAALFLYSLEVLSGSPGDLGFLKDVFHKLLVNFTWWVNRKDPTGRNVFEGGFLGLDNIGVFDRSAPLPTGGSLEQADGTAWMAFYSQSMFEIALELATHDASYEGMGGPSEGMWDEEDGFFDDVLRLPDGRARRLKVRSLVGLLPFCAVTVIEGGIAQRFPTLVERYRAFGTRHPDIQSLARDLARPGVGGRLKLSVLDDTKLRRVLARLLDESEFFGPYGVRSLSRHHRDHPYILTLGRDVFRVDYEPAESTSGLFGGNSNWRGPVWFPMNMLIYRALIQYYSYYGDDFRVECPTGSGKMMTLYQVSQELLRRLESIFVRDEQGRRPVYGGARLFQEDPHWRDLILFYEYFHGDTGAGLGASHQTGWTGLVALAPNQLARDNSARILKLGVRAGVARLATD